MLATVKETLVAEAIIVIEIIFIIITRVIVVVKITRMIIPLLQLGGGISLTDGNKYNVFLLTCTHW